MTLLREIQQAAADDRTSLAHLLRKCKILASRLQDKEFAAWIDKELNGYSGEGELPDYREISTHSYCSASNGYQALNNMPVPVTAFPEELQHFVTSYRFRAGIETYERMANKGEDFRHLWPPNLTAMISQRVVQNGRLLEAWWLISNASLTGLVSAVRNRVLSYALDIEALNPAAGEASPGEPPVSKEALSQVFHTHIYGGTNNVAAGSHDFSQTTQILGEVRKGDLDTLRKHLQRLKVRDEDVEELAEVLQKGDSVEKGELAKPVKGWIGNMVYKAATGAWEIGAGAAGGLLTNAISAYLGLGG